MTADASWLAAGLAQVVPHLLAFLMQSLLALLSRGVSLAALVMLVIALP